MRKTVTIDDVLFAVAREYSDPSWSHAQLICEAVKVFVKARAEQRQFALANADSYAKSVKTKPDGGEGF
jgi:hypothetical protein